MESIFDLLDPFSKKELEFWTEVVLVIPVLVLVPKFKVNLENVGKSLLNRHLAQKFYEPGPLNFILAVNPFAFFYDILEIDCIRVKGDHFL